MEAVANNQAFGSNALDNPQTQLKIILDFKKNHFDLLQNDNKKIEKLTSLITPSLPSKQIQSTNKDIEFLEQLFVTSKLNDISNKNPSLVTDIIKQKMISVFCQISANSYHEGVTPQVAELAIQNMIENPIHIIANSLELGKSKSFVKSLFG